MTYYEELGVCADASPEEIRSQYRKQARLYHPDHQTHPRLKEKSESRMRLLNEIVSVLGDPAKRIEYDRRIHQIRTSRPRHPAPASTRPPGAGLLAGVLAALAALCGAGWYWTAYASKTTPIEHISAKEAVAPVPEVLQRTPLSALRRRSPEPAKATAAEHRSEVSAWPAPDHFRPSIPPPLPDNPPRRILEKIPEQNAVPTHASAYEPVWTGDWFYVPTVKPIPSESGLYPPIYTELHLQENSGAISGNYRAIYLVSDKAISGEVRFQVTGRQMSGPVNALQWKAASGASGQIELTQRASNLLHVAWWTTRAGDGPPSLGSGSAVLVRQAVR